MPISIQKLQLFVIAAGCTALLAPGIAAAQVTPGQVGETLKRPPEIKPAPPLAPGVSQERREAPGAAAGARKITVSRFEIAGNTLYSQDQLDPLLADYTNRPLTLLEIYEAADKIAEFYARNGYTLASVNVPPQRIEDGAVRLLVSEGRIFRIAAEGNDSYSAEQLSRYLPRVKPGRIYRGVDLEEGLRVINTLPGLQARAIVRPGEVYGTSEVVIKVAETPYAGALMVDNYGRENIGEFRFSAFMQVNNPLHAEDQLQLLALRSEDGFLNYGYAAYSLPVNFSGTRLNLSYGNADFRVAGAPVDGTNRSGKVWFDHPVLSGRGDSLSANAGVSRTRSEANFGSVLFSGTSITLLEVGATYNHTYADLAVTQVTTNIATNFDKLSRSDLTTATGVVEGDQRFRWELDVQHLHPLPNSLQLFAHANGVYSPDPLVDTSQYSLGGPNSIRGFPASEVRGDSGYFGSVAIRRPFALGDVRMLGRVFADSGKVYTVNPAAGQAPDDTLTSVGIGADASYDRLSLKLDWSFPRDGSAVSDGRTTSRLFGSFSVSF